MLASTLLSAAASVAIISLALQSPGLAGGEWPDGPNKAWYQGLHHHALSTRAQQRHANPFCAPSSCAVPLATAPVSAREPINTRCFEKESKFFKDGTRRRGKLLPAEAFLLIAENSLAMATRYQPELTNREIGEKQPNPNYNEERYAFFC